MKIEGTFKDMKSFKEWFAKFLNLDKDYEGDDLELNVIIEKPK